MRSADDRDVLSSPSLTRCTCRLQRWDLAVIVPLSFIVQMLPVSVNGFGVREATFSFYFTRVGLSMESALLVSLVRDRPMNDRVALGRGGRGSRADTNRKFRTSHFSPAGIQ